MDINPELPEADRLRQWYDSHGEGLVRASPLPSTVSGSARNPSTRFEDLPWRTLSSIQEQFANYDGGDLDGKGPSKSDLHFRTTVEITAVRSDRVMYPGCPGCRKKVRQDTPNGDWFCAKCEIRYPEPFYR
jgi:replication factor A1